jgi:hypothetical protein
MSHAWEDTRGVPPVVAMIRPFAFILAFVIVFRKKPYPAYGPVVTAENPVWSIVPLCTKPGRVLAIPIDGVSVFVTDIPSPTASIKTAPVCAFTLVTPAPVTSKAMFCPEGVIVIPVADRVIAPERSAIVVTPLLVMVATPADVETNIPVPAEAESSPVLESVIVLVLVTTPIPEPPVSAIAPERSANAVTPLLVMVATPAEVEINIPVPAEAERRPVLPIVTEPVCALTEIPLPPETSVTPALVKTNVPLVGPLRTSMPFPADIVIIPIEETLPSVIDVTPSLAIVMSVVPVMLIPVPAAALRIPFDSRVIS